MNKDTIKCDQCGKFIKMAEKTNKKYYLGILGMLTSPLYEDKNELIEKNENQWEKIIEIEI